ncbi:MAG: ubiquinol-cytochrome c reductase iron-sulfur subunit [Streptomyces sp.]|nr:ubiquinol-cytochrome c reductase iron-sulfur subunit [Streptomyces sp.]
MSETGSHNDVSENLPSEQHGGHGGVAVKTDPFADPGLPPHEHRRQDIDEKAAKHSERVVAGLFTLSMLGTLGFIASYVIFPVDKIVYVFPVGHVSALNFSLGLTLGLALFCIGAGAVHWARTLMSDEEIADERHRVDADDELRENVRQQWITGAKESGFGRRKLIRNTMFGAMTLVPLAGVVLLRDLGPLPEDKLRHTLWAKGKVLVNTNTSKPLRPEDVVVGSLTFGQPQGLEEADEDFQEQIAKAAVMIVRLKPEDIKDKREADWGHDGIVVFSKICTHVG